MPSCSKGSLTCRKSGVSSGVTLHWAAMRFGTRQTTLKFGIICLWAAISASLTPIESVICGQRGGRVFGQPPTQAPKWPQQLTPRTPFLDRFWVAEHPGVHAGLCTQARLWVLNRPTNRLLPGCPSSGKNITFFSARESFQRIADYSPKRL
jgi:hypothetical protein